MSTAPQVKVTVNADGLYRVTYNNLLNARCCRRNAGHAQSAHLPPAGRRCRAAHLRHSARTTACSIPPTTILVLRPAQQSSSER